MDEGKKYYTIGSVEKVCDLLDTLSKKSSWELNELATEIGLPKTSVHRFLLTLADKGFVVQEKRRGRYSLTIRQEETCHISVSTQRPTTMRPRLPPPMCAAPGQQRASHDQSGRRQCRGFLQHILFGHIHAP